MVAVVAVVVVVVAMVMVGSERWPGRTGGGNAVVSRLRDARVEGRNATGMPSPLQ